MAPHDDAETQTLLSVQDDTGDGYDPNAKRTVTPLPRFHFIVIVLQLAEPLKRQVIYPFAAELIRAVGVTHRDGTKIGYYVGTMLAIFYLTQAILSSTSLLSLTGLAENRLYFWGLWTQLLHVLPPSIRAYGVSSSGPEPRRRAEYTVLFNSYSTLIWCRGEHRCNEGVWRQLDRGLLTIYYAA
ncbi:Major facilitator superfamily multidrug-resistance DHA1 sub-family [Mycena venus]|uniref:Major facilitator superfamily multidrug-resistance DHA1 sub-family n=1 Tax=Mycena venus TaxID=2733690 RepID=A0A8H6YF22_9AGAR|nr:Major facilitator superfamily multidrug-resistance DHA1 sub-family [Mycena venus]